MKYDLSDELVMQMLASLKTLRSIKIREDGFLTQPLAQLVQHITAPLVTIYIYGSSRLSQLPLNALPTFAKFAATLEELEIYHDGMYWESTNAPRTIYPKLRRLVCRTSCLDLLRLDEPGATFPCIQELRVLYDIPRHSADPDLLIKSLRHARQCNKSAHKKKPWSSLQSVSGNALVLWAMGIDHHVQFLGVDLGDHDLWRCLGTLLQDMHPSSLKISCWMKTIATDKSSKVLEATIGLDELILNVHTGVQHSAKSTLQAIEASVSDIFQY